MGGSEPPEIRAQRAAPLGHESLRRPFCDSFRFPSRRNQGVLVRKRIVIRQSLQAMLFSSLIAVSVAALFTIVSLPAAATSQEPGAMKMEKNPELHEVCD